MQPQSAPRASDCHDAPARDQPSHAMNTPAATHEGHALAAVDWPLRHAQRAFAALIEHATRARSGGGFRAARLRAVAQRTVSALSADDRAWLAHWLAVLTASEREPAAASRALARVDAGLAASAAALLARTHERLLQRRQPGAAA